jgi:hypothetical protein
MTRETKRKIHKVAVFLDEVLLMGFWVALFYGLYLALYAIS